MPIVVSLVNNPIKIRVVKDSGVIEQVTLPKAQSRHTITDEEYFEEVDTFTRYENLNLIRVDGKPTAPPGGGPGSGFPGAGSGNVTLYPIKDVLGVMAADPDEYFEAGTPTGSTSFTLMLTIVVRTYAITEPVENPDVLSCMADLTYKGQVTGPGGKTGKLKWLVSSDNVVSTAVDFTDEFSVGATEVKISRAKSILKAEMEQIPFYLHLMGKVDNAGDTMNASVSSCTCLQLALS